MGHIVRYTRQELEEMIDDLIEFGEGDAEFDAIIGKAASGAEKKEFIQDYITCMSKWYFYLKIYQNEEEFEMCEKIARVIVLEEAHYYAIMEQFCGWFNKKNDKELMKQIRYEFRAVYGL